jgi:hypothetical protein
MLEKQEMMHAVDEALTESKVALKTVELMHWRNSDVCKKGLDRRLVLLMCRRTFESPRRL